ncbi:MAG: NAD-dependent protein deacetylase [Gammaproteobacteria bacterium]|nr:NAD-dependent protein deacetylase [Gammaproteobacteria bacterium]
MIAADPLEALVQFIRRHPRLFVLTGAGCSTESGIPDYRDTDGAWKHRQPIHYQEFVRHPGARQRYWARSMIGWKRVAIAQPNSAHLALVHLEEASVVHQLVTQNVDGLHQRAGSRRVIDLHGRLDTVDCLDCQHRTSRQEFQQSLLEQNADFAGLDATLVPDGDVDLEDVDFSRFQVPNCAQCAGTLKPSVVFFGESVPPPRVRLAYARLEEADAALVVGSSLMVYSGYRFCRAALQQDKPIVVINLGRTRADNEVTLKVEGQCGEVLSKLVERLSG